MENSRAERSVLPKRYIYSRYSGRGPGRSAPSPLLAPAGVEAIARGDWNPMVMPRKPRPAPPTPLDLRLIQTRKAFWEALAAAKARLGVED